MNYSTENDVIQRLKQADLAGPGMSTYCRLKEVLPRNYTPSLSPRDTQKAIQLIKETLKTHLCRNLNLEEVTVPLIVSTISGMNDYLDRDGSRKPVSFTIKNAGESPVDAEVVQAATKWKRFALKQFGFDTGQGLVTDMKAIRTGYFLDHDHSATVSQFDWEKAISRDQRTVTYLKETVRGIWSAVVAAEKKVREFFPDLVQRMPQSQLPEELHFMHAEELLAQYPDLPRKERETVILQEHKAIFLIGIGWTLNDGFPHEMRASDYDDWSTCNGVRGPDGEEYHGINGDILVWNSVTQRRHELTSMGIRVDAPELHFQLNLSGQTDFASFPYHSQLLNNEYPSAIGGGIGLERLYMLLLGKAHIGEVSCTPWPDVMFEMCEELGITLLR
mmetsp:Transcript_21672/g.31540  ORF Transcript_21672/g.31540 Transcript_21672/m.31540 type:complete len:389 (-) Transcript_21672:73-1239(-)